MASFGIISLSYTCKITYYFISLYLLNTFAAYLNTPLTRNLLLSIYGDTKTSVIQNMNTRTFVMKIAKIGVETMGSVIILTGTAGLCLLGYLFYVLFRGEKL